MSDIVNIGAIFGHMISDEELAAVPIAELMALRLDWPKHGNLSLLGCVDGAIGLCLNYLSVFRRGDKIVVLRPNDPDPDHVVFQEMCGKMAWEILDLIRLAPTGVAETPVDPAILEAARIVHPDADDREDWWEVWGCNTFDEWEAEHRLIRMSVN